jgi:hypothetical protein
MALLATLAGAVHRLDDTRSRRAAEDVLRALLRVPQDRTSGNVRLVLTMTTRLAAGWVRRGRDAYAPPPAGAFTRWACVPPRPSRACVCVCVCGGGGGGHVCMSVCVPPVHRRRADAAARPCWGGLCCCWSRACRRRRGRPERVGGPSWQQHRHSYGTRSSQRPRASSAPSPPCVVASVASCTRYSPPCASALAYTRTSA